MKIYLAHATRFDFQNELYAPLRASPLWAAHEWILPHAESKEIVFDSRPVIQTCDLMVAEVSYPSTGMGIEMGWALAHGVQIVAIHRKDAKPSGAVSSVAKTVTTYQDDQDLVRVLGQILT